MHRQLRKIYFYMGAGLVLAGGLILNISVFASDRQNDMSRGTQQQVVRFETGHLFKTLEGKLSPEIFWQDAYDHVAVKWDQEWVDYQYGGYLDSLDINVALVFDNDYGLLHFYTQGLKTAPRRASLFNATGLKPLFEKARAAKSQQPPVIAHGVVMLDGQPYFAAAGQIVPEDEKLFPIQDDKRRVMMLLVQITPASYSALTGGFGVSNIQIGNDDRSKDGFISVPFTAADGKVVTRLWWLPEKPGASFLQIAIPLSIAVFLLLAGSQYLVLRRFQLLNHAWLSAKAKAEAAEQESAAKSAFLGTISHELRTPLNAIIGFADMLKQNIYGPLGSPRYDEYVSHIRSSGLSLLCTINDVIEVSRIEAGDTAVDCIPTDINNALGEAILMVLPKAESRNIRLHIDGEQTGPVWCIASPLSLTHVIARILDNAVKFSMEKSIVEIALLPEKNIRLEIRDYGIGIPAEKMKELGRPFVQGEDHMRRSYAGIGLGLTISRGLMGAMGGHLSISSQEGAGTIVTLGFKAAEAPVQSRAAA